jgi:hypothetical protein
LIAGSIPSSALGALWRLASAAQWLTTPLSPDDYLALLNPL